MTATATFKIIQSLISVTTESLYTTF